MTNTSRLFVPWLATLAALILALTACSTGAPGSGDAAAPTSAAAEADAFPVTIESSLGSTEITEAPAKVVTVDYTDADAALALGVVPVAMQKVTWGGTADGSTVWFDEKLAEIEGAKPPTKLDLTDGVPVDDIIALDPDLVLGTAGNLTKQDFEKLTGAGIAVVAYPGTQWLTPWRETVEITGKALGRTDLANQLIAQTEERIAKAKADHPQLQGAKVAYTYLNPADTSTIGFYNAQENRPKLLAELGVVTPDIVTQVVGTDAFYETMSSERGAEIDADALITDVENAQEVEVITADPLYAKIPAIAGGRLYAESDHSVALPMSAPSPLSIPFAMDTFIPKVAAAVDGA